jgi:P-type Ca2+ transporter type 2C
MAVVPETARGRPGTLATPTVRDTWRVPAETVLDALGTSPTAGLAGHEAAGRLQRLGPNVLVERGATPAWRLLAEQFANTMTAVLAVAAAVTAVIGELKNTLVILAIVILNGIMGFVQEARAERAMDALKAMTAPSVRVVRDGDPTTVPAAELVPGDLVLLGPGDMVAADLRLVQAQALRVSEAALTGESAPVNKATAPLPEVDAALVAERRNVAFSGTAVTGGRGAGVVVATGMATELGRLAELLQSRAPGSTPLQRRLAVLGRRMAAAALVVCGVVFAAGVARGEPVERMFLTAVSLAVAAIPEGLPAVVTVALALGARRMARQRALARKLPAVETLGSVTVICSDKTGTLTENRMLAERVWTPAGSYRVDGDGYAPVGSIAGDKGADPAADPDLDQLARAVAACNDAVLATPGDARPGWEVVGDPTEGALLALAGKREVTREAIERARPRVAELAFDAARRRMSTLHRHGEGIWVASKGALEALLPLLRPEDGPLSAAGPRPSLPAGRPRATGSWPSPSGTCASCPTTWRRPNAACTCSASWPWPTRPGGSRPRRSPPAARPGSPR